MVVCVRCGSDLAEDLFYHVRKRGKIVKHSWCRECVREYATQRRENDPAKAKVTRRNQYLKHQEDMKAAARAYYLKHKERIKQNVNEYIKRRMKTDHAFCVKRRLRHRLRTALRLYAETGKIKGSFGYGVDYELIFRHLGPCPRELADYHVDHIKPLCLFDFNDPEQIRLAFAPENHQWLRKEQNLAKHRSFCDQGREKEMTDTGKRMTGQVVWFNAKKGFGFLTCDQDGKEYFVHYSNVRMEGFKELVSGQLVSYTVGQNNRGPQAVEVDILGEPKTDSGE